MIMVGIGLLGSGTIGRELAMHINTGDVQGARLVGIFDQYSEKARNLSIDLANDIPVFSEIDDLITAKNVNLIVECASPVAVNHYAKKVLAHGKDLLLLSSGGLADPILFEELSSLAESNNCRLMVPSGALGGIDAIRATHSLLQEVTLETSKPPAAYLGSPGFQKWESTEFLEPKVIFEGSALEAIAMFPSNVNVAVTLSLAGIGPQKTRVRVIADPNLSINIHEVVAKGVFGVLRFRLELQPHDQNPRTSYLAIVSALESLRSACSTGSRIGT